MQPDWNSKEASAGVTWARVKCLTAVEEEEEASNDCNVKHNTLQADSAY